MRGRVKDFIHRYHNAQTAEFSENYFPYDELNGLLMDIVRGNTGGVVAHMQTKLVNEILTLDFDHNCDYHNHDRSLHAWRMSVEKEAQDVKECVDQKLEDLKTRFRNLNDLMALSSVSEASCDYEHNLTLELRKILLHIGKLWEFAALNEAAIFALMVSYDTVFNSREEELNLFPEYATLSGLSNLSALKDFEVEIKQSLKGRTAGNNSGLSLEAASFFEGISKKELRTTHKSLSSGLWFLLGTSVALLLAILVLLLLPAGNPKYSTSYFLGSWSAFRIGYSVALSLWGVGWVLKVFEDYQINHIVILGIDPRCTVGPVYILRCAALVTTLWILLFGIYTVDYKWEAWHRLSSFMHYRMYAVICLAGLGFLFIWPSQAFRYKYRIAIVKGVFRTCCSPFFPVSFGDNLIGDVMTSLVKPLQDIPAAVCYLQVPDNMPLFEKQGDLCSEWAHTWVWFAIGAAPSVFRFLQCCRRFRDTPQQWRHIVNSLKYATSLAVVVVASFDFRGPVCIITVSLFASIYSWVWDVHMDWGLDWDSLKPHSSRRKTSSIETCHSRLLSDETSNDIKAVWAQGHERLFSANIYRLAVFVDFAARLSWITSFMPITVLANSIGNRAVLMTLIPSAEIMRRCMWAILRVENEMCTNLDSSRSLFWIPKKLPSTAQIETSHIVKIYQHVREELSSRSKN